MDKQIICSTLAVVAVAVSNPAHAKHVSIAANAQFATGVQFEMLRFGGSDIVPMAGIRRLISRNRPIANDNFNSSGDQTRRRQSSKLTLISTTQAP